MKDSTEKSIKKWLKRKVTITIGMMVAFIITGKISCSEINIYYDSSLNQGFISKDNVIVNNTSYGVLEKDDLSNYTWYNNSNIDDQIKIDSSFMNINFLLENNGVIYDKITDAELDNYFNLGNGIFLVDTSIEYLKNNGIIFGERQGIYLQRNAIIKNLENNGMIGLNSKNGIYLQGSQLENFVNKGILSGYGANYNGVGIYMSSSNIKSFINSGVIQGKSNNEGKSYTGNGIYMSSSNIESFINLGIIQGKIGQNISEGYKAGNGIFSNNNGVNSLKNLGIVAGDIKAVYEDTVYENIGLLIAGAGTNNVTINTGKGGEVYINNSNKLIINTVEATNGYIELKNEKSIDSEKINLILENYEGYKLSNNNFKNLILNGYGTTLLLNDNFILSDSIINGGIDEKSPAIAGSINIDTLTLKGNSIINGNIDLGDGADNLIIANTVQINGELLGGNGGDTLTFNSGDTSTFALNESNINIFNNVDGFETINIATNVTFFETSQVTGANNISIKKDGNLILRIDSTNNYSNAFSNNTGTISSEGGKLLLALNGIGEGETINLGKINLDDTIKGNEIGYSSDITLDTTSLLYTLARGEGNTIKVNTVENLPVLPPIEETPEEDDVTPPIEDNNTSNIDEYNNLNSIYQSIRDNNLVKEFDVTDDNKLAGFYSYLHDIYAGNPVAFSSALSKKSSSMFIDIVMNKDLTTDINKWSIYGGFTHIDGGTKDSYYGKKDYTYNIVNKDIDVDSKISGMYALGEYGLSNNSTFGIIFGGNQEQSKLNNGSKVDGDSFYLGTYTKKYLGNLKLVAGLGYQYGDYKSDRVAIGYENIIDTKTYHSNYNDNTLSIYGQAKYSNKLAENLYLEPSVGIEYTYIDQNESSESGILGIETESKEFNYTTAKFGVDLRKDIPTSSAIHSLVAGVYYNRMLDGYDVQNIKGSFKEGNSFDILVSPSNKHELGLRAKYELSLNNGVTFDLKGSYTFAREKYNNDNKNEYKGEWLIGTGIGYKF